MSASASNAPESSPTPPERGPLEYWLGLCRPLLTVDEARYLLGDPAGRTVVRLLDAGTLRAIDISVHSARARQRVPRIFRSSVEHLLLAPGQPTPAPTLETLLPHTRPTLRRDEVAMLLNCTPRHVEVLGLTKSKAAGTRAASIGRGALLAFLKARLLKP